jgi:protease YdgD
MITGNLMRLRILFAALLSLTTAFGNPASAESGLVALRTGDDVRNWQAVGRLNLNGTGFCTGALVANNLVVTAAHCMFDKKTGRRVKTEEIEFLAGWRDGRAAAYRKARRVVIHSDYVFDSKDKMDRVASDLALIELDQPIRNSQIKPFSTSYRPLVGEEVHVVSYAQERSETPSLQETCHVLGRDPSILVLSCDVNFGSSGAPIFVTVNGEAHIASVVSAKAVWKQKPVALATSVNEPLKKLMSQLKKNDGVFSRLNSTSGLRNDSSVKFLKVGD